ncbi:MAG: OpgC protein [Candidatus Methanofastidiosum methylothiophilum]|uniref:OpgC protein n=1 Tax=Candidatus Methanofastidiosum methylothiophilum TaxID=1705564 RepID=A0A150IHQ6_9EURY|nr:MAG: OpgC protein [Candidatus Methanofastidiosum methylthiophilus]KYC46630.1 MAG: OpgC protein [Candidatus Methanofastidiosum methylthiophilus]KYC49118.1 MAG: OpgC protein [Candidatus Methanofastidiosum methylthiophilus]
MENTSERFWEIDFLRGVAIIMMVVYHLSFDLYFLANFPIKIYSLPWVLFQRTTASLFLLLVGISLTLSYSRAKEKYSNKEIFMKNLRRGIKIFIWGAVITLFTFVFLSNGIILFGILHLIGTSIIISYPLIEYRYKNLVLGLILILLGFYLDNFTFDTPYLLWLGFEPSSFFSFDYFPILPWYGLVLIGIFLGNSIYPNSKRRLTIPDLSNNYLSKSLSFLGKHSLKIYLIHQPVIILLLYALGVAELVLL